MAVARVFQSRGRQIVVRPKGIRLKDSKVDVQRDGIDIVLRVRRRGLGRVYDLIRQLPADMFDGMTDDGPPQHRDGLCGEAHLGPRASSPALYRG